MARTRIEAPITTRNARRALGARKKPYCRSLGPGIAIGYQRKKRGGVWQVIEYQGAKNYRQSQLGIADDILEADGDSVLSYEQAKQRAVAEIAKWRRDEKLGAAGPPQTVRTAIEAYVAMRDSRQRSLVGTTAKSGAHRLHTHALQDPLATFELAELTEERLQGWIERRPKELAAPTIRRIANDLKAALNAAGKKHRSMLPAEFPLVVKHGLSVPEDASPMARDGASLSDANVREILAAARTVDELSNWDGDLWRLIVVLASTGARFNQIARLKVADVQLSHSRIMVPTSRKGRGTKKITNVGVRVGADVVEVLQDVVAGRRNNDILLERWRHTQTKGTCSHPPKWIRHSRGPWLNASELTRPWALIVKHAQLPADTVPYSLRHSSIVRMLRSGLPLRLVASLHDTSSAVIERHYASSISDAMDDLAAKAIVPLIGDTIAIERGAI